MLYHSDMDKSGIGARIKALRTSLNLSQNYVAQEIGVSQTTINYWERGERTPTADKIPLLALFFCVSPEFLLGITDNPNRNNSNMLAASVDYLGDADVIACIEKISPYLNQLNNNGLNEAEKRIKELSQIPEYKKYRREPLLLNGYTYKKELKNSKESIPPEDPTE